MSWLTKSLAISNWKSLVPLPSEVGVYAGAESSKPLITRLVLLATRPHPWVGKYTNTIALTYRKQLDHYFQHLGNSKGFETCEPETVDEDQIKYLLNYNIAKSQLHIKFHINYIKNTHK